MNIPPPSESKLPEGVPEDDKEVLYRVLFHAEELQHSRVYYFLVAETFFLLAAASAYKVPFLVIVLSFAGMATAVLFTVVNLKHYWRMLWLTEKLRPVCGLYDRYVSFHMFCKLVDLGPFDQWLASQLISQKPKQPIRWHSTGWLFTWGLFGIIGFTWLCFFVYGVCAWCPTLRNYFGINLN